MARRQGHELPPAGPRPPDADPATCAALRPGEFVQPSGPRPHPVPRVTRSAHARDSKSACRRQDPARRVRAGNVRRPRQGTKHAPRARLQSPTPVSPLQHPTGAGHGPGRPPRFPVGTNPRVCEARAALPRILPPVRMIIRAARPYAVVVGFWITGRVLAIARGLEVRGRARSVAGGERPGRVREGAADRDGYNPAFAAGARARATSERTRGRPRQPDRGAIRQRVPRAAWRRSPERCGSPGIAPRTRRRRLPPRINPFVVARFPEVCVRRALELGPAP